MNLRIILIVSFFVNIFADQSKWFIHDDAKEWNDDDGVDFMSKELLLPVKTKNTQEPKPVKVTRPAKPQINQLKTETVQSKPATDNKKTIKKASNVPSVGKRNLVIDDDELSSHEFIIVDHSKTKPKPSAKKIPVKSQSVSSHNAKNKTKVLPDSPNSPCFDKDVNCLLAMEELLAHSKKSAVAPRVAFIPSVKTTTPEPKAAVQAHRVADNVVNAGEHAQRHLLLVEHEVNDESDEDILNSINDQQVKRYRRQATGEGDGGSGAGFFEETTDALPPAELEFSISQTITLEDTVQGPLSETDRALYSAAFKKELERLYAFFPGFKRVDITDVTLNAEGKPQVQYSIVLNGAKIGAFGSTPDERLANILGEIKSAGNVFSESNPILGSNIVPPDLNLEDFNQTVSLLLSDVCNADDPCPAGYMCTANKTDTGEYSDDTVCMHACYFTKLNVLCQNDAICTLDSNNEPYCQCGTSHSGVFCENEGAQTSDSLSTAEVIGITTGTLLAVAACASCCFFLLFCRKKSGTDMEYSYYGDDDNLMEGYMDQASSLGISNMYIDRPRVSIQPLDIYNDRNLGAQA
ncbi:uncharacterized protein LOC126832583 isoform X2 [Patella vulgata]|uniref:uncharacterized protein LOC126832583 isoform X2 n=1 Tax=Patella vulgata TaxID=6465 RepID=UPI00217FDE5E|nr:uncharacterized protein LOC126832583 isoform X2 [Patella vulgata]